MSNQKMRKDLIRLKNARWQLLSSEPIEGPEQTANEHERSPHGQAKCCAKTDPTQGATVRTGDKVALHYCLISRVLLQVEEETIDGQDNDRWLVETHCRATKTHLPMLPGVTEYRMRTLRWKK